MHISVPNAHAKHAQPLLIPHTTKQATPHNSHNQSNILKTHNNARTRQQQRVANLILTVQSVPPTLYPYNNTVIIHSGHELSPRICSNPPVEWKALGGFPMQRWLCFSEWARGYLYHLNMHYLRCPRCPSFAFKGNNSCWNSSGPLKFDTLGGPFVFNCWLGFKSIRSECPLTAALMCCWHRADLRRVQFNKSFHKS